jgi:hypothetical protein
MGAADGGFIPLLMPITLPSITPTPSTTGDSSRLDMAQLQRIQNFLHALTPLEVSTNALIAERTRRMTGARAMAQSAKNQWYRVPEPASGCPPLGPLALSWQDIFDSAKANLLALANLRPPRWTSGDDVVRWFRAVQWNLLLLLDATNIRPVFRWPTDYDCAVEATLWTGVSCAEARRGATTTLLTPLDDGDHEGMPYPGSTQTNGIGHPLAMQALLRAQRARTTPGGPDYVIGKVGATPIWLVSFDQSLSQSKIPYWIDPLTQLPGGSDATPGLVIDVNPAGQGLGSTPNIAKSINKYWRDLQPVTIQDAVWAYPWTWNPSEKIDGYIAVARVYATLDLPSMLLESIGWYVHNHLPFWRSRGMLSLSEETVTRLQQQVQSAAMRNGLAPARLVGTLASAVNPIVGAVIGLLTEIAFSLLDVFIGQALDHDIPRRLFVRSYPSSCIGVVAEDDLTLATEEAMLRGSLDAKARADAEEQLRRETEAAVLRRITNEIREDNPPAAAATFPWAPVLGGTGLAILLALVLRKR